MPKYILGSSDIGSAATLASASKIKNNDGTSEDSGLNAHEIYQRNLPWVKAGTHIYNTVLTPDQEKQFRSWVQKNKVLFDPNAHVSDYDMRGFWLALQNGDPRAKSAVDPNDKKIHYPDYWKTPYDATFSNQSQWANPESAPHWTSDDKLVTPDGRVIWDDRAKSKEKKKR